MWVLLQHYSAFARSSWLPFQLMDILFDLCTYPDWADSFCNPNVTDKCSLSIKLYFFLESGTASRLGSAGSVFQIQKTLTILVYEMHRISNILIINILHYA